MLERLFSELGLCLAAQHSYHVCPISVLNHVQFLGILLLRREAVGRFCLPDGDFAQLYHLVNLPLQGEARPAVPHVNMTRHDRPVSELEVVHAVKIFLARFRFLLLEVQAPPQLGDVADPEHPPPHLHNVLDAHKPGQDCSREFPHSLRRSLKHLGVLVQGVSRGVEGNEGP